MPEGVDMNTDAIARIEEQVRALTPSTDGVTLQVSKWDATENFGVKASGFLYNQSSYAVRVYKAR